MSVTFDLRGRTALVTGSSRGIGAAIARALGRGGGNVMITYNTNKSGADEIARLVEREGGAARVVALDVADEASVAAAVKQTAADFGGLDILVNNAGLGAKSSLEESSAESWRKMFEVNLLGAYFCVRAALGYLKESKHGRIINISSSAAKAGGISGPDYAAAKAGLEAFTRCTALELAPRGIPVNAVSVASVETDLLRDVGRAHGYNPDEWRSFLLTRNPMGRMCAPEEVAELVAFLSATDATYLSGAVIPIHGARA